LLSEYFHVLLSSNLLLLLNISMIKFIIFYSLATAATSFCQAEGGKILFKFFNNSSQTVCCDSSRSFKPSNRKSRWFNPNNKPELPKVSCLARRKFCCLHTPHTVSTNSPGEGNGWELWFSLGAKPSSQQAQLSFNSFDLGHCSNFQINFLFAALLF